MIKRLFRYTVICFTVLAILFIQATPAAADGGIVIPDSVLWGMIAEGQQIAVIQLGVNDIAKIDLFITMLDRSGESHEVVFFVPLGEQASNFNVTEESSLDFDESLTSELDEKLKDYASLQANYTKNVKASLLLGTIATNGLWSGFVIVPLLLSSCSVGAPAPVATYQTESSFISIYAMDEATDIQALIETAGLDEGVRSTLEDLQGQQIAVVKLQTRPKSDASDGQTGYQSEGQPGIHLTWETELVRPSAEASYTYPLGTGRAWANPIELTRIYIVAPPEVDLEAQYPRLGADLSGIENGYWSSLASRLYWRIDQAQGPAYSIDKAFGSYGQVWRLTYIKSNADRDVNIIKKAEVSAETQSAIRHSLMKQTVLGFTWLIGLAVGIIIWLFAWWLVMSRVLKAPWQGRKLWGEAFLWCLIYPGFIITALFLTGMVGYGILWLFFELLRVSDILNSTLLQVFLGIFISLPALLAIAGVVNAFLFARSQAKKLTISRWRAFGGYFLVVLVANLIYLLFSQAYILLTRVS